jgi:integrase
MALTDTAIKQYKHSGKPAGDKYADGGGLYLLVKAAGKYWRMKYRFAGKEKTLAFGVYPTVKLAQAREKREEARALLAAGADPGAAKQAAKRAGVEAAGNTFEAIARELHGVKISGWSASYAEKWLRLIEKDLFPYIGGMPLAQIEAPDLLAVLRRVEGRGATDIAHTLCQEAGQVFRYGVATGRCGRDPAADLRGALKPNIRRHMSAILEPAKVGELMRAIYGFTGQQTTQAALQLLALTFQRPGNIRAMEWTWVDLDKAMLTIPAESMKRTMHGKLNGRPHLVPLAPQAVAILRDLQPITGSKRYVFQSGNAGERPMSENTANIALIRMGFQRNEMTAHGFRAMARTLIAERFPDIPPDVIEAQLAHSKSGPLGEAYDRAKYMPQRVKMMREWADYLDRLRKGADVIPFPRAA